MSSATSPAPAQVRRQRDISEDRSARVSIELVERFALGSVSGPNDAFGRVMHAAFSRSGRVLIADDLNHRIAVFGPSGGFLGFVGRQGNGPGEFQSPWLVASDEHDSLFVWDSEQARFSVFDSKFTFVRSFRARPQWLVTGLEFLPGGELLVAAYGRRDEAVLHRLDRDGRYVESLDVPAPKVDLSGFEGSLLGGYVDFSDGVIAYTRKSPYELSLLNGDGRIQRTCAGRVEWTTKPDEVVVRTERGTGLQWNRYVHSSRVLALGRGLYLNVVHDPRRNRAILDVLRDDCTLLKRHALDIPIVVMDRLDDLVLAVRTIDYPEVVVYGYRLHLREP